MRSGLPVSSMPTLSGSGRGPRSPGCGSSRSGSSRKPSAWIVIFRRFATNGGNKNRRRIYARGLAAAAVLTEAPAPVARGEEVADLAQLLAPLLGVGEVEGLALPAEAADHDRLGTDELLQPVLAVAEANARVLPAAHGDVRGQEADEHVVDVGRADLEPPRDGLRLAL